MAEEFTCAVDEIYRSACKDLPKYSGSRYCVLHEPDEAKNKEDFLKVKSASLTGKTTILVALSSPKVLQTLRASNSMRTRILRELLSLETQFSREPSSAVGIQTSREPSSAVGRQTSREPT